MLELQSSELTVSQPVTDCIAILDDFFPNLDFFFDTEISKLANPLNGAPNLKSSYSLLLTTVTVTIVLKIVTVTVITVAF